MTNTKQNIAWLGIRGVVHNVLVYIPASMKESPGTSPRLTSIPVCPGYIRSEHVLVTGSFITAIQFSNHVHLEAN